MNGRPEKKRYVIECKNNIFEMTSPNGNVSKNIDSRKLANQAFDEGADEVAHNYDLTILEKLIKVLSYRTETELTLAA